MLALLSAPVKSRFALTKRWFGVAVLLFVETFSLCAWAQQNEAPAVQDEATVTAQAEKKKAEVVARKEALAVRECQRMVTIAIGRVVSMEIHPEVLVKSKPGSLLLVVSLDDRTLSLLVDGQRALLCPISCGRIGMDTDTGDFTLISKSERAPVDNHYGSLVDSRGNLLLKGVYSHLDPVPVGATFVPSPPNVYFTLSEGVVIHSGDANGTASTNGAVVIPTTAARTLFRMLEKGIPVQID
ncbi:MAG: hypothetical protein ACI9R3_003039 [Verrucomicrobiales bacterium]|jgi:hypothetical protein